MDTQKEIQSIQRDNAIIKLMSTLHDNVQGLKNIIDLLTTRIEKLEKEKNEICKKNFLQKKKLQTQIGQVAVRVLF